ncbi:hypothetical protein HU200_013686 [Digitaria exilis]|uniref:F-box domain-containing protein n=1 Tax=Digitaria exilis TaxID=1010633 RepID=A0A835FCN7_9POAL|nr:hypothetical protein HU200_013686 [Digitaria exilis]
MAAPMEPTRHPSPPSPLLRPAPALWGGHQVRRPRAQTGGGPKPKTGKRSAIGWIVSFQFSESEASGLLDSRSRSRDLRPGQGAGGQSDSAVSTQGGGSGRRQAALRTAANRTASAKPPRRPTATGQAAQASTYRRCLRLTPLRGTAQTIMYDQPRVFPSRSLHLTPARHIYLLAGCFATANKPCPIGSQRRKRAGHHGAGHLEHQITAKLSHDRRQPPWREASRAGEGLGAWLQVEDDDAWVAAARAPPLPSPAKQAPTSPAPRVLEPLLADRCPRPLLVLVDTQEPLSPSPRCLATIPKVKAVTDADEPLDVRLLLTEDYDREGIKVRGSGQMRKARVPPPHGLTASPHVVDSIVDVERGRSGPRAYRSSPIHHPVVAAGVQLQPQPGNLIMPPQLPDDVVEEILARFPPDEPAHLVRAALACKACTASSPAPASAAASTAAHPLCSAYFNPTSPFRPTYAARAGWLILNAAMAASSSAR